MIDLQHAKEAFERYLDGYDRENDKVKLKIVHTYGVVECSRKIAEGLKLSEEDRRLAEIIGLLHDIGRFEQLKRYDSFEPGTMDHASFGVEILFEEGMIRQFVKEDTWDGIIRTAIARHSDYCLDGIRCLECQPKRLEERRSLQRSCSSSKHRCLSVPRQERRRWITGCRILRTFMTLILM